MVNVYTEQVVVVNSEVIEEFHYFLVIRQRVPFVTVGRGVSKVGR